MTKEEAENELYQLWSNGEIPSNFTYEHSEYDRAVEQLMEYGQLNHSDFF